jgi:hypothetical protein
MGKRRSPTARDGAQPEEVERLRRRVAELEEARRRLERENAELVFENTVLRRHYRLSPRAEGSLGASLLVCLLSVLSEWATSFRQARVFGHAVDLALGLVVNGDRNTLTGVLRALCLEHRDWSAMYRVFSRARFEAWRLFEPVIGRGFSHDHRSGRVVALAVDDTSVRKTGKRNRSASLLRDPLSPPYHPNLELRQRLVVVSALVRPEGERGPCWGVPVGCLDAPPAGRAPRGASAAVQAQHAEAQKRQRLGRQAAELCETVVGLVRDAVGKGDRLILWCVDGSLTNRTFLDHLPAGTDFIGRTRRDAALHAPANVSEPGAKDRRTKRVYGERLATPEAVLCDATVPWQTAEVYVARAVRTATFKEVGPVLWRSGSKRRPLRLLVIKAAGYRRKGSRKLEYRQPAYLLTSDLSRPAAELLQAYFDRWEIEPGFRDLKTEFGLGQAQVWSPGSVSRVPSFVAATYGALKVACLDAFGPHRVSAYGCRAKWRNDERLRPSLRDARDRVRLEAGLCGVGQRWVGEMGPAGESVSGSYGAVAGAAAWVAQGHAPP